MDEAICGNCVFRETEDGAPYCVMKDLYTHVEADHECDESNWRGELYFLQKRRKDKECKENS